ncbi:MAG: arginine decarboxylase [Ruminococcus sp.]|nr:arginine decarboxylase [Ruminococcus sp.]
MRYIDDFVTSYNKSGALRIHMPGHKGRAVTGCEELDITEIKGADYLFEPGGIIKKSEEQMARAYGSAAALYSTEGSSLCIKAMLGIIKMKKMSLRVLAGRNCHKAFIDGCALLDADVRWIYPARASSSVCSSFITAEDIGHELEKGAYDCVYLTSPDYLGFMTDIGACADVCRKHGVPLLVDNAHGAYLRFTENDLHPMSLGASMCCDSAHKTLPCLTGTAMLHIAKGCEELASGAEGIMSMFGSTSPSYLLMRSLDIASDMLACGDLPERIKQTERAVSKARAGIEALGFRTVGSEPLKITVWAPGTGLSGDGLAQELRHRGIECEYSDPEYLVLMPSVMTTEDELGRLVAAFSEIPKGTETDRIKMPVLSPCERAVSIRDAAFSPCENVSPDEALGRICARTISGCQPAVPVAVCGEIINKDCISVLKAYAIDKVSVIE